MYLHLGSSVVIRQRDVVGIFDLDNTTSSRITRDFLTQAQRAGRVVTVGDDLPKAVSAAYALADRIHFDNAFCRRDIGRRALEALGGEK